MSDPHSIIELSKEKDKQMNVVVMNLDNTKTTYGFDPQHEAEAIGFYAKEFWAQKIQGFTVNLADGESIVFGVN
jgi:hypothetical protein